MSIRVVPALGIAEPRLSFTSEEESKMVCRRRQRYHTQFILRTRGINRDVQLYVRVMNAAVVRKKGIDFSNGIPMELNSGESSENGLLEWHAKVTLEHEGSEFKYFYSFGAGLAVFPDLETERIAICPISPSERCILVDNINLAPSLAKNVECPKRIHFHLRCKIPQNARVFLICEWNELYRFEMRMDSYESFSVVVEVWPDCHKLMYDYQIHNSGGISTPKRVLDLRSAQRTFIIRDSLIPGSGVNPNSVRERKLQTRNELKRYTQEMKSSNKHFMIQAWREQALREQDRGRLYSGDPRISAQSLELSDEESVGNVCTENNLELDQLRAEIDEIHEVRFGDIRKLREDVRMLRAECSEMRRRTYSRR